MHHVIILFHLTFTPIVTKINTNKYKYLLLLLLLLFLLLRYHHHYHHRHHKRTDYGGVVKRLQGRRIERWERRESRRDEIVVRKRSFMSSFERTELSWGDAWTLAATATTWRRAVNCFPPARQPHGTCGRWDEHCSRRRWVTAGAVASRHRLHDGSGRGGTMALGRGDSRDRQHSVQVWTPFAEAPAANVTRDRTCTRRKLQYITSVLSVLYSTLRSRL